MKISKTIIITFFLLLTNIIFSQETNQKLDTGKFPLPVLNNHKFVINGNVRSPFIKTYFSNSLGFGEALDLKVPIMEIDGEPLYALRGTLYFVALNFEYQYAINDWVAVWVNAGMFSRIGDGAQTLLAQGMSATTNFELGWMFKLLKTKRTLLSGTINMWNNNGMIINIYDFVKRIIDEGGLSPDNKLIVTRNFIQLGGGLRFAWAASELVGVNLLSEFAYGESVDRKNENELFYNLAGSMDIDLNNVTSIPIGFSLGAKFNSFIAGSDTSIRNRISAVFFKTAYTKEDDFLIGLDFIWSKMPLSQINQNLYGGTVLISIDYYF